MKQKYKYLKLLDKSLLNLILEHSELEENEYKVVKNTLITEDLIEKQCTNLSISNSIIILQNAKSSMLLYAIFAKSETMFLIIAFCFPKL